MANVNKVSIPFPDFKLLDVIDPDQFDENNHAIVEKINEIIENMLSDTGDFKGTWNGVPMTEATEGINGGRLDVLEPKMNTLETDMDTLQGNVATAESNVSDLKRALKMSQKELATLHLKADAATRIKDGYSFGDNGETNFNMNIDYTRTTATSNLVVGQTFIPCASADGFKVGQEITIVDDVNIDRTKITNITGTTLSVDPITKDFKNHAIVARSTIEKTEHFKELRCTGYVANLQKQFLSGHEDFATRNTYSTGTSATNYTALPNKSVPTTVAANRLDNKTRLAFEFDVVVPYSDYIQQYGYTSTIFSQRSTGYSTNGFTLGYIFKPYSSQPDGSAPYIRPEGYSSVSLAQNTFIIGLYNYAFLAAPDDILLEYADKAINIKLEIDLTNKAANDPVAMVTMFINNKRIPLRYITTSTSMTVTGMSFTNTMKFFYAHHETSTYSYVSNAKLSRFVVYDGFTYQNKLVEYDFGNIVNNEVQDLSGKGNHMSLTVSTNSSQTSWYTLNRGDVEKPVKHHDIRFTVPLKSKEAGTWVTRDGKELEAVEGSFGDVSMTLTKSADTGDSEWKDDQLIATRAVEGDTEIRVRLEKITEANFPRIARVVGGVF